MFRHNEYVTKEDYPFNAGYVVYANYFFPSIDTGESSEIPLKPFPSAYKQNFEYFVDNELDNDERAVILKTFQEKKPFKQVAEDLGMSVAELTALRTKAFSKLRSVRRTRYILSDEIYVPKQEKKQSVTIGNVFVESQLKTPDLSTGGGEYRLISVRKNNIPVFSLRLSTKTNNMTDDEVHDFLIRVADLANRLKLEE